MGAADPDVKTSRRYDATRRRDAAARTRERVLDTAETLFLRHGYAATTVTAIARAAGVSDVLLYKSFGGKAGLVLAIQRRGLAGAGPVPAPHRSDQAAAEERSAVELICTWAHLAGEVAPRATPITLLVCDAAAQHQELVRVQAEIDRQRLDRMTLNAHRLTHRPGTRTDLSIEQIRDVLWTYSAPQIYDLLVLRRRWPIPAYVDFLTTGMTSQLTETTSPPRTS